MGTNIIMKIGFVILFTTYLCYLFNIYGIKYVSPTVVSAYIYLQPVLTTIIAILNGKEEIEFVSILCSFMIFGGVYLVSINTNKIN